MYRSKCHGLTCPTPGEDDGHLISHLVLGQVAEEIERQYSREQAVVFLEESAIDLYRIRAPAELNPELTSCQL